MPDTNREVKSIFFKFIFEDFDKKIANTDNYIGYCYKGLFYLTLPPLDLEPPLEDELPPELLEELLPLDTELPELLDELLPLDTELPELREGV